MINFEGIRGTVEKNVRMGKLSYENPKIKLWSAILKIADGSSKTDKTNTVSMMNVYNIAKEAEQHIQENVEVKASLSPQSTQIASTQMFESGAIKDELSEIIALLKETFISVGSENKFVFDVTSADFDELRQANTLSYKMSSSVGKVKTVVLLELHKQFIERINSLIVFSQSKGFTVNALNKLKDVSRQLIVVNGKRNLDVIKNENLCKQTGKKVQKGITR